MTDISPQEVEKCKRALSLPAPQAVLKALAIGAIPPFKLTGRNLEIKLISPEAILAGSWPLYRSGAMNEFGEITDFGRSVIAEDALARKEFCVSRRRRVSVE